MKTLTFSHPFETEVFGLLYGSLIMSQAKLTPRQTRRHAKLLDKLEGLEGAAYDKENQDSPLTLIAAVSFEVEDEDFELIQMCATSVPWVPRVSRTVSRLYDKLEIKE